MGNELWFMKFEIDRWRADLDEHPLEIEGAWIRICCRLWMAPQRGSLTLSTERWATILRYDETNANRVIDYLLNEKIASGKREHNGYVTLVSRRMIKEEKERELNRLRQQTYRDNKKRNKNVTDESRPCHGDIKSYSNSNILDKELKAPSGLSEEIQRRLKEVCERLYQNGWKKAPAFLNAMANKKYHPEAILKTLEQCEKNKPEEPWAYGLKIIQIENQSYNARDFYAEEKERLKDESNPVKDLTKKIGKRI